MRRSMQATALMTTALLALTACGSGGGSGASQPQEQQTASATTADPSSVSGELTWWDTSDAANEAPVFKQMIAEFNKTYPNVKINYQSVPFAEAQNKFKTAAAAKSGVIRISISASAWSGTMLGRDPPRITPTFIVARPNTGCPNPASARPRWWSSTSSARVSFIIAFSPRSGCELCAARPVARKVAHSEPLVV